MILCSICKIDCDKYGCNNLACRCPKNSLEEVASQEEIVNCIRNKYLKYIVFYIYFFIVMGIIENSIIVEKTISLEKNIKLVADTHENENENENEKVTVTDYDIDKDTKDSEIKDSTTQPENRYNVILESVVENNKEFRNKKEDMSKILSYKKKITIENTPDNIVDFWDKTEINRKNKIQEYYNIILHFQSEIRKSQSSSINKNISSDKDTYNDMYIFKSEYSKSKYISDCSKNIRDIKISILDLATYKVNIYPYVESNCSIGVLRGIKDIEYQDTIKSYIIVCSHDKYKYYAIENIYLKPLIINHKINELSQIIFEYQNKNLETGRGQRSYPILRVVNISRFIKYE